MKSLRTWVFWPTVLLISASLAWAIIDGPTFSRVLDSLNQWMLARLSPVFAFGALGFLVVCFLAYVSPLGRVIIGGQGSGRIVQPFAWCTISLCTTTAVGILFWSMAEPIIHFSKPPISTGLVAGTHDAGVFALSTLFMHWTFIPCAIYAMPALVFALAFYNLRLPFSLASCLVPALGRRLSHRLSTVVDGISLFALVSGMAASLATGVLTLAGGLEHLYGVPSAPLSWNLIGVAIVLAFLISALSGLHRGVTYLSNINTVFFFVLAAYVLWFAPTAQMLALDWEATQHFVRGFTSNALFLGYRADDPWPKAWTVFYWSVWLAWAPVTAAFLGRIGRGYSVRQFLLVNLALPAVFSYLWMGIFGASALTTQISGVDLVGVLQTKGAEGLVYDVLETLPLSWFFIPTFLITAFISYVTSADSNTMAMAGMSSHGVSADSHEPSMLVKILWGGLVGASALVILGLSGIDGIKSLSYLGGIPALFFELVIAVSLLRLCWDPEKFGLAVPGKVDKSRIPTVSSPARG